LIVDEKFEAAGRRGRLAHQAGHIGWISQTRQHAIGPLGRQNVLVRAKCKTRRRFLLQIVEAIDIAVTERPRIALFARSASTKAARIMKDAKR